MKIIFSATISLLLFSLNTFAGLGRYPKSNTISCANEIAELANLRTTTDVAIGYHEKSKSLRLTHIPNDIDLFKSIAI